MNKTELLTIACTLLNKNKNFNVSLKSIELYDHRLYGDIFTVTLIHKNKPVTIYLDEWAFEEWNKVPWGGQTVFRPENWDEWNLNDKLILTMCWCVYNYCLEADKGYKGVHSTPPGDDL